MIRKRTSKSIAKRHDLNYFKKGSPIRNWQWRIAVVALAIALAWLGISSWRGASAFSAGPVSAPHAVFGQKCVVCHTPVVRGAGWLPVIGARHHVPDTACLSCHQVGQHHTDVAAGAKACSTCHIEHVGAMHLAAAPVHGCTQCHAALETSGRPPAIATKIESFTKGHPEFRVLRTATLEVREAAYGLKFNHQEHLAKGLTGPNGAQVTLECASCHRLSEHGPRGTEWSGRMAPVNFDRSCRSCHSLEFDKRTSVQAPHADAATVLTFVQTKMNEVAPHDDVALVSAETIVFRQKCALCHAVSGAGSLPRAIRTAQEVPVIAPAKQPEKFFTSAIFSHNAHGAVQCAECHAAALGSTSGKDNLLPRIAVCQQCHDGQSNPQGTVAAGHAESGCSLCHEYHQGGRQHPDRMTPAYRIDELTRGR